MSAQLLETMNFDSAVRQTPRGGQVPHLIEIAVNPDLGPFLVSSTRSVTWVPRASQEGMVRAAVRPREGLETDLVAALVGSAEMFEWGNIHPLTPEGVRKCIEHLNSFDFTQLEALVSPLTEMEEGLCRDIPVTQVPWMPLNAIVFVPVDRSYVGTFGTIGQRKALAVVHNASRGVAVAWK